MNALELLVGIGAMDEETNELTDLGICLSGLSLEPREYLLLLILLLHEYLFPFYSNCTLLSINHRGG